MHSLEVTRLRNEIESWDRHYIKPQVVDASSLEFKEASGKSSERIRDLVAVVPPPGSMVIYYGPPDGRIIYDLNQALSDADQARLSDIGNEARNSFSAVPELSDGDAINEAWAAECLFDVRVRGKTVVETAGLLRGMKFGTVTLSYVGTTAPAPDDFQIVEYRRSQRSRGYDYLIGVCSPVLTDLERSMLGTIPHEMLDVTVGSPLSEHCINQVCDVARQMVREAVQEAKAKARKGEATLQFSNALTQLDQLLRAGAISPTETASNLLRARQDLLFRSQLLR